MDGQLSERVLLVEDEPLIRRVISVYLVAAGYVVRVAADGLDALARLRAGLPDLIISDLNMPRMSGFEFLGVVRQRFPQIPVIAISGLAASEISEKVTADAFYHKNGFGFDQLLQTISDLTKTPSPRISRPPGDNQPFRAKLRGDAHYVVDCPDCLRSVMVPCSHGCTRGARITICIHCRGIIPWLIDDQVSAADKRGAVTRDGREATGRTLACEAWRIRPDGSK